MNDYSKLKFLKDYNNLAQDEALLNEIKGALFEYLTAAKLAQHFGLISDFLVNINESQRSRLQQYESWLRENRPSLLNILSLMTDKILEKLSATENQFPSKIDKIIWSGEEGFLENKAEGDIILYQNNKAIPLSLKMCKLNSFVNTKSAGLKSVIKNYFGQFKEAEFLQHELTQELESSYAILGQELYDSCDLGEFSGKFEGEWTHSHLPGKLPGHLQKILYQHYYRVSLKLQQMFLTIYQQSNEEFLQGLWALCGLTDANLWQIIWQYESQEQVSGKLGILNRQRLKLNTSDLSMTEVVQDGASFSVLFAGGELQIRVKPMNVFTTPAMKINCAIKYEIGLFASL
jgi:hypothetical protein